MCMPVLNLLFFFVTNLQKYFFYRNCKPRSSYCKLRSEIRSHRSCASRQPSARQSVDTPRKMSSVQGLSSPRDR